jgi:hypothetical protein
VNKLLFISGILLCSTLFLSSGAVIGIFISHSAGKITIAQDDKDDKKPERKPKPRLRVPSLGKISSGLPSTFSHSNIGKFRRPSMITSARNMMRRPSRGLLGK